MQLLLPQSAHDRLASRLDPFRAGLDVVTMSGLDEFNLNGAVLPAAEVDAELTWVSLDAAVSGLAGALFERLAGSRRARWAQVFLAGLDNPVLRSVMERGVRVTKSNAQAIPIAEYVVAHALSLIVPIAEQARLQAKREWRYTRYREVGETRWTLVGFGAIGREIAARIKPFGVHLTVVRRDAAAGAPGADQVVTQAELAGVLPETDVLVLACPINARTRDMADAALFAALKPGAILINIGRGGLVVEDALRSALDGPLAAAVLDVFQIEPLPVDHWLWSHPKVRVSAHTSSGGSGMLARGDALFLDNLARFREGRPLLNEASRAEVGL